jgi:soluble lytic murein transglycosylase-like protein
MSPMKFLPILFLLAPAAIAGEYAVLASGMRLHIDRHELQAGRFTLYSGDGSMVLAQTEVASFEADDYVPPKSALPVPVVPAAPKPAPLDPKALVTAAARKSAIPERLLQSVVKAESAYQPNAMSPKGAIGLMQLMPTTASQYGADPTDPAQNVEAGTAYLRDLLIKYKGDVPAALAAYNAGPGAVDKYHGVPPYPETNAYIRRVITNWQNTPKPVAAQ